LFVGSGVSTESKTAFPDTFYSSICQELNINPKKNIPFSTIMSLYCKKTGGKHQLLNKIKERLDYFKAWSELYMRATDFHSELALLPCIDKIVTTNWDDFLEVETKATPFVYDNDMIFWDSPGKKVLKMHGSINSLGSIVATEEDYKKWLMEKAKDLVKSGVLGHVHLSDNFGWEDEQSGKMWRVYFRPEWDTSAWAPKSFYPYIGAEGKAKVGFFSGDFVKTSVGANAMYAGTDSTKAKGFVELQFPKDIKFKAEGGMNGKYDLKSLVFTLKAPMPFKDNADVEGHWM